MPARQSIFEPNQADSVQHFLRNATPKDDIQIYRVQKTVTISTLTTILCPDCFDFCKQITPDSLLKVTFSFSLSYHSEIREKADFLSLL